jgi:hypothetical protein
MSTVSDDKPLAATWKNGQVVLDEPADWPEGCRLQVAPIRQPAELVGIPDDQWPRDPQGIAELLKRMDQIEPFEMTPEEEADWLAWRRKIKEYELANFSKRVEGLFEGAATCSIRAIEDPEGMIG